MKARTECFGVVSGFYMRILSILCQIKMWEVDSFGTMETN